MAKQLQSVSLGAAGFNGVNTMDPPLQQSLDFADTANNAVIDNYGRLGARKGYEVLIPPVGAPPATAPPPVTNCKYWIQGDGTPWLFFTTDNEIYAYDMTDPDAPGATGFTYPAGYAITEEDWCIVDFNGGLYFFQDGYDPIRCDDTLIATTEFDSLDNLSGDAVPAAPTGGIAHAAYGRIWASSDTDKSTVYWSALLDGAGWTEGDSGSIDLTTVWPNGYDELVAINAHNERIIFFGRNSIIIYTGATNPATMELEDAFSGIGCAFRGSVVNTGDDVIYCSYTGVKSLGRTVTQNSLPSFDLTKNIRNKIQASINSNTGLVRAVYSQEESFYLLTFADETKTYCIDMKQPLDDGARKVTIWPDSGFKSWERAPTGVLYCGTTSAMSKYGGYDDDGDSYEFTYFGPALDFGDGSRVKVMKRMITTMVGGLGREATFYWGYGYSGSYRSQVVTLANSVVAEYGIAEYNVGFEFSGGTSSSDEKVNTTGSGEVVRVGLRVSINGTEFSLQQLRVHVIMGKIV